MAWPWGRTGLLAAVLLAAGCAPRPEQPDPKDILAARQAALSFDLRMKREITTRMLLSHRAGLPTVDGTFTLDEALAWTPVVEALAAQAPRWVPGTKHGYHLRTFSWLVGETFRRAAGRTIGTYWRDEIAGPLQDDLGFVEE